MISVYIDNFSHVLESIEPLYEKGDKFSIGFSKTSETSFEVYSHLNQHGEKLVRYIVDITQYEQGKIHSLYFIPNYKTTIPNDRVLDNVQMHLSEITAMKAEYFMKMKGGNYNTVAFYIIPGTNDCVVYTRMSTLFEGIEPIITQESDIHAIIGGVYPAYVDKRPENTLRLSTILALDPNDSLAYVEAQLDFKSAVLATLVEASPELKLRVLERFPQYANFMEAAERNAVFTVKDTGQCLEEIRENKSRARELQREYYTRRAALRENVNG